MLRRLVLKDWHFNRTAILICLGLGALSLKVLTLPSEGAFYAGSVLLISVVIGLGIHLVISTVVYERKHQTLPFVMSLPISPMEYVVAKILANLSIFAATWTILCVATLSVIWASPGLPNGLLPLAVILLAELFAAYCLTLAVALITESEGWTIVMLVVGNLFFNYFLYFITHLENIATHLQSPVAVWNRPVWWTLAAITTTISLSLAGTLVAQTRKTDFL
ncbi:MAG: ABC-2 transporter permease [Thermoanaerobaculia bacterium]|nr:ABC-2 transporter permease [Thermoanaerobaculia bacterium]